MFHAASPLNSQAGERAGPTPDVCSASAFGGLGYRGGSDRIRPLELLPCRTTPTTPCSFDRRLERTNRRRRAQVIG